MKPGETPFESASRILKRELGLIIPVEAQKHVKDEGRFIGIGAYSYTWQMREQEPKTNGCADISVVMAIEGTKKEIESFKFDNQEYDQHSWLDAEDIVQDETKHPALRRSVEDFIRGRAWNEFESIVNQEDDAVVGKKIKELISKWKITDAQLTAAYKRQKLSEQ